MSETERYITGEHKAQLAADSIHALVVLVVVIAVTILLACKVGVPGDVAGTVYGSAIGYAAGRAGNIQRLGHRATDAPPQAEQAQSQ